ncbi:MAG: VPLPA-CTERM sorting domain-containing protein [Syntrophus sp. (in: bacteria)]|nr:VPLPA-CTERM sorting domain-containing protein [Syntrophus sp. (in: bacteria)]
MKKSIVTLLFASLLLAVTGLAQAAPLTDVVQAPTGYFVPSDALKYSTPYYRDQYQDWGWQHSALAVDPNTITSATLNISAFDVDNASSASWYEHDLIYAYDGANKVLLGELAGADDIWSYTTFTLAPNFYDDIVTGLKIWMDIDTTSGGNWLVTLSKSALSIDGGSIPNPNPNPNPTVPIPGAILLFAPGLAGLAALRRRMSR